MPVRRQKTTPLSAEELLGYASGSHRLCDHKGCQGEGIYPAPKSRSSDDYHLFCYDHVCSYNKTWNYFDGCSEGFLRHYQRDAMVGMRPTWRFGTHRTSPRIHLEDLNFDYSHEEQRLLPKKIRQALSLFSLPDSYNIVDLKKRYRHLVKLHHPDAHHGKKEQVKKMSAINDAYHELLQFVQYGTQE